MEEINLIATSASYGSFKNKMTGSVHRFGLLSHSEFPIPSGNAILPLKVLDFVAFYTKESDDLFSPLLLHFCERYLFPNSFFVYLFLFSQLEV